MSDALVAILAAVRAGDLERFEELVQEFGETVTAEVTHHLQPPLSQVVEVEDVVQQVWLTAYRCVEQMDFRATPAFTAWLRKVAQSRVNDLFRQHFKSASRPGVLLSLETTAGSGSRAAQQRDLIVAEQRGASTAYREQQRDATLDRVLGSLDPKYRTLLVLTFVEHLTPAEIAVRLGISDGAARARLRRALKKAGDKLRLEPDIRDNIELPPPDPKEIHHAERSDRRPRRQRLRRPPATG